MYGDAIGGAIQFNSGAEKLGLPAGPYVRVALGTPDNVADLTVFGQRVSGIFTAELAGTELRIDAEQVAIEFGNAATLLRVTNGQRQFPLRCSRRFRHGHRPG